MALPEAPISWFVGRPKHSDKDSWRILPCSVARRFRLHLCWLDNRHRKKKLALSLFPLGFSREVQNCEIAYCHTHDSDATWSKEVILSEGLLYSFSPSMSVEGDKIVITWAGIPIADSWHTRFNPNDVYYVTSGDGGKTWTEPLKVTDAAKDGIASGVPQVVLLNGVIHMTYIQGKMNLKQESPGLTKLNQPPWPIYYTHRPFPK